MGHHPARIFPLPNGDKIGFRVFGPRRRLMSRFGLTLAQDALTGVEEAAQWARLGL